MLKGLTLGLIAATMSAAYAGEREPNQQEVRFTQTELHNAAGAEAIYARITAAATAHCKSEFGGTRFVHARPQFTRCVSNVTAELVAKADAPRVTSLHEASSKRR